jgi:hypothetical protein
MASIRLTNNNKKQNKNKQTNKQTQIVEDHLRNLPGKFPFKRCSDFRKGYTNIFIKHFSPSQTNTP